MDRGEQIHPRTGTLIEGRYRILRCIGEGGMGSIHEVIDLRTDVRRALKLVRPALRAEASFAERLLAEARIVARIKSEHLVPVSDAGIDGDTGAAFFVMELLEGESLAALSKRRGRASFAELVAMLHQVALALDRAHAAGVAHLDLKPANLFATSRDDGSPSIKVLDFGIARAASERGRSPEAPRARERAEAPGSIAGTPMYMAPEQLSGGAEIGPRADLHALGMVAFTLLVGEAYFEEERASFGEDRAGLRERIALGIGELPSVRALRRCDVRLPPAFDVWLTRATARRPEDRFATATDAVTALARALGEAVPRPSLVLQGASRSDPGARGEGGETTETALSTDGPAARPRGFRFRRAAFAVLGLAIVATGVLRLGLGPSATDTPGSTDTAAAPRPSGSSAADQGAPDSSERPPISAPSVPVSSEASSADKVPISPPSVPVSSEASSANKVPVSLPSVPVREATGSNSSALPPNSSTKVRGAGASATAPPSASAMAPPRAAAPSAPVPYEGIY